MHQAVDRFCDGFEPGHEDMKPLQETDSLFDDMDTEMEDEESVRSRLAVFVDDVNNAMMDTLRADCETNSLESVALLEEVDQEVRRRSARTLRHVVNTKEVETGEPEPATEPEPGAEAAAKPKKGFLARVWQMFVRALKQLWRVWRRVLAWVQEKLVACWRFVCKVVEGVVEVLGSFCSWVVKVFV